MPTFAHDENDFISDNLALIEDTQAIALPMDKSCVHFVLSIKNIKK